MLHFVGIGIIDNDTALFTAIANLLIGWQRLKIRISLTAPFEALRATTVNQFIGFERQMAMTAPQAGNGERNQGKVLM